ncbi:MAG: HAD family hydrolase [Pseudomonadota bacterium]
MPTLITDVDNTLLDWIEIWSASFSAMFSELNTFGLADEEELKAQIKRIHQSHGTSEYAYLLEELPALASKTAEQKREIISRANGAWSDARHHATKLYPGVRETLVELKSRGFRVIAFTESFGVYTAYRFRECDLDGVVDVLYSPEDHFVSTSEFAMLSHSHSDAHVLENTELRHTPAGVTKPSPDILRSILAENDASNENAFYVGDNLMKDIAMAQQVGVPDFHAMYGHAQHRDEYELLKQVTHWPDRVVELEEKTNLENTVLPTYTLTKGFHELLGYL